MTLPTPVHGVLTGNCVAAGSNPTPRPNRYRNRAEQWQAAAAAAAALHLHVVPALIASQTDR